MAPSTEEIAEGGGASTSIPPPPTHREIDDEFLLNQTRIWLEIVLNKEFDRDVSLSDLLADGQILFDVYKEFRKMLISVNHPSQHKFLEKESVSSTKVAEIYPYVKVERFLQVCKILGVRDAELFPTSDVVHKHNTLQVCTCLRSLSKNAMSWKLDIPEFDCVAVTHRNKSTMNMPMDTVGIPSITPDNSEAGEYGSVQSEIEQLIIEDPDEDEIADTSSSVGDSYQLVDHQSNHDHENNFPSRSSILVDSQAPEEALQSDDITADDEIESNGDKCNPPWKLLKMIAGGTGAVVAVGFMLYFFLPRKKGTEEKKFTLPNPTKIAATEKRLSREELERGCTINKFYPACMFRF